MRTLLPGAASLWAGKAGAARREGGPHGITDTHKDRLSADLLAFVQA